MLLPKLTQLRYKLEKMQAESGMLVCGDLVESIRLGLAKRFESFFTFNVNEPCVRQAIMATVSHPGYKLRWVAPDIRENVTQIFIGAAKRIATQ